MTTVTQNWLGCSINFENVEDKTSDNSFELLLEGFRKAEIKNVIKSVLGENEKPALTVTLELLDEKKEMVTSLYLPENGDEQSAIDFKLRNLRNFFTRMAFADLTKTEYDALSTAEKEEALKKIQTNPKGEKQFIGKKCLVDVRQEPFIAQDKETKAIKFTDIDTVSVINKLPKQLLKQIETQEKKGMNMEKLPVFLFSNKIAAYGFGFYNDFDPEKEFKNSKSYDFIQSLDNTSVKADDKATTQELVPQF